MLPYVFQVCIAHVLYAEDEDVTVGCCGCLDFGVDIRGSLFVGFLLDFGGVHYARSL